MADNVAYRRRFGNTDNGSATFHILRECEHRYDNVFLLDRLSMQDDAVRTEDEDEAREKHEAIRQAYLDLGMDPIEIPVMPVDERADAIEEHITHSPPIH